MCPESASTLSILPLLNTQSLVCVSICGSSRVSAEAGGRDVPTTMDSIKVISWNIDGLCMTHIDQRTEAVISAIQHEKPCVVLLQEVIDKTLDQLSLALFPTYHIIYPSDRANYFVAILLRRCREVSLIAPPIFNAFPGSIFGRQVVVCDASFALASGTNRLVVLASHLESTADRGEERAKQLKAVFEKMGEIRQSKEPAIPSVLFGGDTNLLVGDLERTGGTPSGISDVWEMCGSQETTRYTRDTVVNDNGQAGKISSESDRRKDPRRRIDIFYFCDDGGNLEPRSFELLGTQRLSCGSFPSDHFGIMTVLSPLATVKDNQGEEKSCSVIAQAPEH